MSHWFYNLYVWWSTPHMEARSKVISRQPYFFRIRSCQKSTLVVVDVEVSLVTSLGKVCVCTHFRQGCNNQQEYLYACTVIFKKFWKPETTCWGLSLPHRHRNDKGDGMVGCVTFIRKSTNLFDFITQSILQFFQFWKKHGENYGNPLLSIKVDFWFRC